MKILDVIQALFPSGYMDYDTFRAWQENGEGGVDFSLPTPGKLPYLCTDLFAVMGVLLQRSGAYHHVAPDSHAPHAERTLSVSEAERTAWALLGEKWRGDGVKLGKAPPKELVELWQAFWQHRAQPIYAATDPGGAAPAWWRPALSLLAIADEAARGLGFEPPNGEASFQSNLIAYLVEQRVTQDEPTFSFSTAETDLACILPKSRTPMVGCTLRSLSHHLALLPPRGLARAYWLPYAAPAPVGALKKAASPRAPTTPNKPLNCLLVPMPFRVQAQAIRGVRTDGGRWGWFEIEPSWCLASNAIAPDAFATEVENFWSFILSLIEAAERDVGEVHVLVFPEAALSSAVFRELKDRLEATNVELLIAGLFDRNDAQGQAYEHGNFAALGVIGANGLISTRPKHHRWRLDESQIQTYALGASLDPNYGWWENIDILSRSLDVYVLRGTTTVTTLICEDLARHDPCQELVRGIGPNLVFALLMDGPQLKARWPARYATVLAEDPGSSVLSFTSLGLIERSNATGLVPPSRKIGLWRDDRGETIELTIPNDAHALCLNLQATRFEEHALDGRSDHASSESWRLSGVQPVKAPPGTPGLDDVLAGRWPSRGSA